MDKLKKIEQLLSLVNGSLSKEDFINAFEKVLSIIQDLKKNNDKEFELIHKAFILLENKIKNDTSSTLSDLKKQVDSVFVGNQIEKMLKEHRDRMSRIDKLSEEHKIKLSSIKNGKDGYTPIKGKDYFDGIHGNRITAIEVRDKLETLKDEDRLDKSAIKGLKEEIENLKEMIVKSNQGRSLGGSSSVNSVQYADLTSQCNGVTKTFQVPRHRIILGLQSTQFPIIYRPITDFTTSNLILTLTDEVSAPATGQTLIFTYIK